MSTLEFSPFRIDLAEERLWREGAQLALRRKPFAILKYLATNPERLVTYDELLREVWAGAVVSESAVRSHLHELRQVLGEGVIETVIGRGYRFIAPLLSLKEPPPLAHHEVSIIGRRAELDALASAFALACEGKRQSCFIVGDPGIGKSTLVDAFLASLHRDVVAVRGHSIEQHGPPEAYAPVIEIVARMFDSHRGSNLFTTFLRHAPTFLSKVPYLVPDASMADVEKRARASSDASAQRELLEAFEVAANDQPLVLVFEDVHWSDLASLDLLSALGQRRDRTKLLVLATSRRAEMQTVANPINSVARSLIARGHATTVSLDRLGAREIGEMVARRFPSHAFPVELATIIDRITGGTALFVSTMLEDLVERGLVAQVDGVWKMLATIEQIASHRADNLLQLIDMQLDRLTPEEQQVLAAGAVIGPQFSSTLAASALGLDAVRVDEVCTGLARRHLFLQHDTAEELPSGEIEGRYRINHGLVQEVCLGRGSATRRQRWNTTIAERLEHVFGNRDDQVLRIAHHHEHGTTPSRAVPFYIAAAERTATGFATADALAVFRRARALLLRQPANAARDRMELRILQGMSSAVLRLAPSNAGGLENPGAVFEDMATVARRFGDPTVTITSLVNLANWLMTQAEHTRATQILDEVDAMSAGTDIGVTLAVFRDTSRAVERFWVGDVNRSLALFDQLAASPALAAPRPEEGMQLGFLGFTDPRTVLHAWRAILIWLAGRTDEAIAEATLAEDRAISLGDPYTMALAATNTGRLFVLEDNDAARLEAIAQRVLALPDSNIWWWQGKMLQRCAQSMTSPLSAEVATALYDEVYPRLFPIGATYHGAVLVATLQRSDRADLALALCDELLTRARERGERVFESDLHRRRGEMLEPTNRDEAMGAYRDAVAVGERQGAIALVERAARRLAALGG